MSEQFLHLFDRHSFVDGHCGKCPAEFMRMNFVNRNFATELAEAQLHSANFKSIMWLGDGYEECRIVICPAFEVLFQM